MIRYRIMLVVDIVCVAILEVFLFFVNRNCEINSLDKIRCILTIVCSIALLVLLIFGICSYRAMCKLDKNKYMNPYGFEYYHEYDVYTNIIANKKNKKNKFGNESCILHKYSEWKTYLMEKYNKVIGDEDFYRYLVQKKRGCKNYYTLLLSVALPVELGAFAGIVSLIEQQTEAILFMSIFAILLVPLFSKDIIGKNLEICFIDDVIEIIYYKEQK